MKTGAGSDAALVALVWRRLGRVSGRWLLVVDNADDPQVLAPGGTSLAGGTGWVRDPGAGGVVVVTSRVTEPAVWGARADVRELGVLDDDSAVSMLLDRMGHALEGEAPGVRELARRLGGLPLVLHLAGSFLGSDVAGMDASRVTSTVVV